MHCFKCGLALPPEITTCPSCGTFTPYNTIGSPLNISSAETAPSVSNSLSKETRQSQLTSPPSAPQSISQQRNAERRSPSHVTTLLLVILSILIIDGSGLIYYVPFAHSAGLQAQATTIAQTFLTAQAQATSPQAIYMQATKAKPTIDDPLSDPSSSIFSDDFSGTEQTCGFVSGAFHISTPDRAFYNCFSKVANLSNFVFQVQMTITQGYEGGILFRAGKTLSSYYIFSLSSYGFYDIGIIGSVSQTKDFNYSPDPVIKSGLGQPNLLTVIAIGSTIYLYVNKQYIATVIDSTYKSGEIGLQAFGGLIPSSTDVAFSNAQVWKL
jgi:hypothetical protein